MLTTLDTKHGFPHDAHDAQGVYDATRLFVRRCSKGRIGQESAGGGQCDFGRKRGS